jgi:hypothetical protein
MEETAAKRGWRYLILSLAVIGIYSETMHSPVRVLIQFGVVGVVLYLYKRPPRWLIRFSSVHPFKRPRPGKKAKKKQYPFRVIDGKKKKSL